MSEPLDEGSPASGPRLDLTVPEGWEPVAEVVRAVWDDREELIVGIVDQLRRTDERYASLPRAELVASVRDNIETTLVGLAENRWPTVEEIRSRRRIGRRRAEQGVPADAMLAAFRAGYESLWAAITRAVPDDDGTTARLLVEGASTFWRWLNDAADALGEAHAATLRAHEARVVGARQRLAELVAVGATDTPEVQELTASVGFSLDGDFQSVVVRVDELDGSEARQLQAALDLLHTGVQSTAARGSRIVAFAQRTETDELAEAVREAFPDASAGIGLVRQGLEGARDSLVDAELALAILDGPGVARFEEEWLWATLTRGARRLRPMLSHGVDVASDHGHLARTVEAFADSGFSVSEAARRLQLHANTVAYRLERWHSLTGWDPRTFPGLARSLAAIRLGVAG